LHLYGLAIFDTDLRPVVGSWYIGFGELLLGSAWVSIASFLIVAAAAVVAVAATSSAVLPGNSVNHGGKFSLTFSVDSAKKKP